MTISTIAPNRFPIRVVVLLISIAMALLLLLSGVLVQPAAAGSGPSEQAAVAHVQHHVQAGDTLWGIAESFTVPGDDVRHTIHDIKAANGLDDSMIRAGQVLLIPVEF